jgi:hypothetical protein
MSFRPELAQVQGPRFAPPAWRHPGPSQPWPLQPHPSQPRPSQPWPSPQLPPQPWSSSANLAGHSRGVAVAPPRTPYAFAKAFACAAVIYVVATGLLLVVLLGQLPSDATAWQLGNATRRAFIAFPVACIAPAFITGVIVHWSSRIWPLWQVAATFLPMFFLVAAIQLIAVAAR